MLNNNEDVVFRDIKDIVTFKNVLEVCNVMKVNPELFGIKSGFALQLKKGDNGLTSAFGDTSSCEDSSEYIPDRNLTHAVFDYGATVVENVFHKLIAEFDTRSVIMDTVPRTLACVKSDVTFTRVRFDDSHYEMMISSKNQIVLIDSRKLQAELLGEITEDTSAESLYTAPVIIAVMLKERFKYALRVSLVGIEDSFMEKLVKKIKEQLPEDRFVYCKKDYDRFLLVYTDDSSDEYVYSALSVVDSRKDHWGI